MNVTENIMAIQISPILLLSNLTLSVPNPTEDIIVVVCTSTCTVEFNKNKSFIIKALYRRIYHRYSCQPWIVHDQEHK